MSCLLSLLRQMSDIHFQHLLDNFQSKEELKVNFRSQAYECFIMKCFPLTSIYIIPSLAGVLAEDFLCVQKPDEAQYIPA